MSKGLSLLFVDDHVGFQGDINRFSLSNGMAISCQPLTKSFEFLILNLELVLTNNSKLKTKNFYKMSAL